MNSIVYVKNAVILCQDMLISGGNGILFSSEILLSFDICRADLQGDNWFRNLAL